jgi:outer membrane protein
MKNLKIITGLLAFTLFASMVSAQKYAYLDMEYILNNIPSYKAAQNKLDELSKEWQEEIETMREKIDEKYKKYQSEKVLLSEEMKQKREDEIINMEKNMREKQKKYFGKEGKLFEKRKELVKPIQEEVYQGVQELAEKNDLAVIFDTSSGMNMIYTDPKYDRSDDVLKILGYKD